MKRLFALLVMPLLAAGPSAVAQDIDINNLLLPDKDTILLTVFLKHDQSMNNVQRGEILRNTGFNESFPPDGVTVVDHYIMMGIGQVIVLRLPPDRLRALNVAIERGAWGAYQTEFYITYDIREARAYAEQQENRE